MDEVLAGSGSQAVPEAVENEPRVSVPGPRSVIGVLTVPPWEPVLDAASYQDVLEALADVGTPLRAKEVAVGVGLGTENLMGTGQ
ncbi:hypothetical protein [Streptomyces sp. NPDC037389]|uniref:hypothetical protein n=1 Tax=Streptomyces sp. NPDC037389 TaxID=3155369 RepID=UPI0033C924AD